jgi:hypothetical protein
MIEMRKQHRIGFAASILLLVMSLVLAGCEGKKNAGGASASPAESASAAPASSSDGSGSKSGGKTEATRS